MHGAARSESSATDYTRLANAGPASPASPTSFRARMAGERGTAFPVPPQVPQSYYDRVQYRDAYKGGSHTTSELQSVVDGAPPSQPQRTKPARPKIDPSAANANANADRARDSVTSSSLYPPSTTSSNDSPPSPSELATPPPFASMHMPRSPLGPNGAGTDSGREKEKLVQDSEDVAFRLQLLMKNTYYLPPAHAKPDIEPTATPGPGRKSEDTTPVDGPETGRRGMAGLFRRSGRGQSNGGQTITAINTGMTGMGGMTPPTRPRTADNSPLPSPRVVVLREPLPDIKKAVEASERRERERKLTPEEPGLAAGSGSGHDINTPRKHDYFSLDPTSVLDGPTPRGEANHGHGRPSKASRKSSERVRHQISHLSANGMLAGLAGAPDGLVLENAMADGSSLFQSSTGHGHGRGASTSPSPNTSGVVGEEEWRRMLLQEAVGLSLTDSLNSFSFSFGSTGSADERLNLNSKGSSSEHSGSGNGRRSVSREQAKQPVDEHGQVQGGRARSNTADQARPSRDGGARLPPRSPLQNQFSLPALRQYAARPHATPNANPNPTPRLPSHMQAQERAQVRRERERETSRTYHAPLPTPVTASLPLPREGGSETEYYTAELGSSVPGSMAPSPVPPPMSTREEEEFIRPARTSSRHAFQVDPTDGPMLGVTPPTPNRKRDLGQGHSPEPQPRSHTPQERASDGGHDEPGSPPMGKFASRGRSSTISGMTGGSPTLGVFRTEPEDSHITVKNQAPAKVLRHNHSTPSLRPPSPNSLRSYRRSPSPQTRAKEQEQEVIIPDRKRESFQLPLTKLRPPPRRKPSGKIDLFSTGNDKDRDDNKGRLPFAKFSDRLIVDDREFASGSGEATERGYEMVPSSSGSAYSSDGGDHRSHGHHGEEEMDEDLRSILTHTASVFSDDRERNNSGSNQSRSLMASNNSSSPYSRDSSQNQQQMQYQNQNRPESVRTAYTSAFGPPPSHHSRSSNKKEEEQAQAERRSMDTVAGSGSGRSQSRATGSGRDFLSPEPSQPRYSTDSFGRKSTNAPSIIGSTWTRSAVSLVNIDEGRSSLEHSGPGEDSEELTQTLVVPQIRQDEPASPVAFFDAVEEGGLPSRARFPSSNTRKRLYERSVLSRTTLTAEDDSEEENNELYDEPEEMQSRDGEEGTEEEGDDTVSEAGTEDIEAAVRGTGKGMGLGKSVVPSYVDKYAPPPPSPSNATDVTERGTFGKDKDREPELSTAAAAAPGAKEEDRERDDELYELSENVPYRRPFALAHTRSLPPPGAPPYPPTHHSQQHPNASRTSLHSSNSSNSHGTHQTHQTYQSTRTYPPPTYASTSFGPSPFDTLDRTRPLTNAPSASKNPRRSFFKRNKGKEIVESAATTLRNKALTLGSAKSEQGEVIYESDFESLKYVPHVGASSDDGHLGFSRPDPPFYVQPRANLSTSNVTTSPSSARERKSRLSNWVSPSKKSIKGSDDKLEGMVHNHLEAEKERLRKISLQNSRPMPR